MSVKTLQKTWSEIYQTFARLSALVTNAQANICCEDLCHQIHKHLKEADLPVSYYMYLCVTNISKKIRCISRLKIFYDFIYFLIKNLDAD